MGHVLIVVDMLEGFLTQGYPLYCGPEARKIVPFVKRRIAEYAARGEPILTNAHEFALQQMKDVLGAEVV